MHIASRLAKPALLAALAASIVAAAPTHHADAAVKRLVKRDWCKAYGDRPVTSISNELALLSMNCFINRARAAAGVPPLTISHPVGRPGIYSDAPLFRAALGHAQRSAQLRWWSQTDGSVSHVDPETGSTPADRIMRAGYCPQGTWTVAENTFTSAGTWTDPNSGLSISTTPRGAVTWWLNDPPHRATLLNPAYTEHSIAVVPGLAIPGEQYDGGATFVEDLGGCR